MSALVGHLGPGPGGDERIQTMLRACFERAPTDPQRHTLTGPVPGAFGWAGFASTLHSEGERQPVEHLPSGVVIAADVRLDNRDELYPLVTQELKGRPAGDAELALLAYLRWGTSFAEHLLGDFVIALFDPRSSEVVLARDHLGIRPILYSCDSSSLVFGSTLRSVRDGTGRTHEIYTDKLQHAMLDPLEIIEPDTTFYRGILRLPAASTMVWSPGSQPQISRYWTPQRGDLTLDSDDEYREAFREVFDKAVACRLLSARPVAAMLSGGLDSSTVIDSATCGRSEPLRTYSFVESNPKSGSDAPAIRACQATYDLDPVSFDEVEIAERYDLDTILSDPDSAFDVDMSVLWTTADRMSEAGYGVVLTGVGGDEIVAAASRRVADGLVDSGSRLQALREMVRTDGTWTPRRLARFLVGRAAPGLGTKFRSLSIVPPKFAADIRGVGIDPRSADGKRLLASLATLGTVPEWNTGDSRIDRITRPMLLVGLERYDRVTARHGIEVRHPICDKRLIDLCLSLPGPQLQRDGWSKWILRTAFPSLPASVAWRPKEYRGMGPATAHLHELHGPKEAVIAPNGTLFGELGPVHNGTDFADQWERHVVSRWWAQHGH